jgi:hypothetical protein
MVRCGMVWCVVRCGRCGMVCVLLAGFYKIRYLNKHFSLM